MNRCKNLFFNFKLLDLFFKGINIFYCLNKKGGIFLVLEMKKKYLDVVLISVWSYGVYAGLEFEIYIRD